MSKQKYSSEDEFKAIILAKLCNHEPSKRLIYEQYKNMVHMLANKTFNNTHNGKVTYNDFVSEGFIGLFVAMQKHNPVRCNKLYPTAYLYVKEHINSLAMDNI